MLPLPPLLFSASAEEELLLLLLLSPKTAKTAPSPPLSLSPLQLP